MECKGVLPVLADPMEAGFNRNIVECKVLPPSFQFPGIFVLIETLWNVKSADRSLHIGSFRVLIETLWNVKNDAVGILKKEIEVLIETLWNVKISFRTILREFDPVLIETLWNVKQAKPIPPNPKLSGF